MIVICTHKSPEILENLLKSIRLFSDEIHKILVVETSDERISENISKNVNWIRETANIRERMVEENKKDKPNILGEKRRKTEQKTKANTNFHTNTNFRVSNETPLGNLHEKYKNKIVSLFYGNGVYYGNIKAAFDITDSDVKSTKISNNINLIEALFNIICDKDSLLLFVCLFFFVRFVWL